MKVWSAPRVKSGGITGRNISFYRRLWQNAMKAVDSVKSLKSNLGPNQELILVEIPHAISDFI